MSRRNLPPLAAFFSTVIAIAPFSGSAQEGAKNVIPYMSEQPVRAQHGMVVSVHHLAADAGVEVLRAGGNAVDAAVATGFALAVVHPAAGNLGGGGFMLIRMHDGRAPSSTIARRRLWPRPKPCTRTRRATSFPRRDLQSSVIGYRSIATPGSVAGMTYAELKYGKLGLAKVMAPAIKLASDGFVLTTEEARELTDPTWRNSPTQSASFSVTGMLIKTATHSSSRNWRALLSASPPTPADFYHGKLAHELIDELKKGGALLTLDDLAQYSVVERAPITGRFHNYTVISAPPPSSGGIVLLSALNILEGYDLKKMGDRSPTGCILRQKLIGAPTWTAPTTWATRITTTFPPPRSRQAIR
jgi:gamma-glutamyltranspeptidase/glutathione hydrolase